MFLRILILLAIGCPMAAAQTTRASDPLTEWLAHVPALQTGDQRPFQFRVDIDALAEQLVAYVSWAPPARRCVILCDRVDGLPLMIAVNGQVWMYDLIGGQILHIRAEPEFLATVKNGVIQVMWGMRADFPDWDSRTTIRADFGGMLRAMELKSPGALVVNGQSHTATFRANGIDAVLEVDEGGQMMPVSFFFGKKGAETRHLALRFDSFASRDRVPSWHQSVNEGALPKQLAVLAVADAKLMPAEVQERLDRFSRLLRGGGVFILRPALRDFRLQQAIEKNSPVSLNFALIRANNAKLRDLWRIALHEQGFELPKLVPTTRPIASDVQ